jgi:hypothetical protein
VDSRRNEHVTSRRLERRKTVITSRSRENSIKREVEYFFTDPLATRQSGEAAKNGELIAIWRIPA